METFSTGEIIKNINARLEADTRINLHRSPVTVKIENNAVILEGEMDNIAEKRATVDAATRTLFRRDHWQVVDRLDVKPASRKGNRELKEGATLALLDEPVFRAYTILARAEKQLDTIRDMKPDYREILAEILDGRITLSGQVESLSHQRLAEVLMWWTPGCRYVLNLLQIVPPEQDNDNEINDAVRMVLEKDPLVHSSQLAIHTAGGVVEMLGSLASKEEKKIAVMDAWYVPGVSDVVDRIDTRD